MNVILQRGYPAGFNLSLTKLWGVFSDREGQWRKGMSVDDLSCATQRRQRQLHWLRATVIYQVICP